MSHASPVIVSFYCGDEHYYAAGAQLRADCVALGLDHDIVEMAKNPSETWLHTCRRKIGFFLQMHSKHRRPILWLDVDSRLAKRPSIFDSATCDMAGFLRGWRYLRDFDPLAVPRFFAPFALYFNYTAATVVFLNVMAELESKSSEDASDDFFLHEAWLRHTEELSVMVLPPSLVAHTWPAKNDEMIYVGISGNVSKFKAQAKQHVPPLFSPERRKAVLVYEANAALKSGQPADALVLYKRALAAGQHDESLATKIARLITRQYSADEAESFLRDYRSAGFEKPLVRAGKDTE